MGELRRKLKVQKRYDRWAPIYDKMDTAPGISSSEMRIRREAVEKLRGLEGTVIDVGSGSGLILPWLAEVVEGAVIGVDFSRRMLIESRKRMLSTGRDNWEVVQADTDRMPFPDGSVEGAIATFALTSIPDYKATIADVFRALRPGGKFVVLDMGPPSRFLTKLWFYPLMVVTHIFGYTYIERDTISAVLEAGFRKVSEKRKSGTMVFLCVFEKPEE